jgi:hypothetical protein
MKKEKENQNGAYFEPTEKKKVFEVVTAAVCIYNGSCVYAVTAGILNHSPAGVSFFFFHSCLPVTSQAKTNPKGERGGELRERK